MLSPYLPRLIRGRVLESLADTPVVCLLGPRQAGKTTLAQRINPKRTYLNLDDPTLLEAARQDPLGFVEGLPERVILDEVQRVPELLLAIKSVVDRDRQSGRFLLTGSANLLLLPKAQESLAGRMEVIYLHPLTEQEKRVSTSTLLGVLVEGQLTPRMVPDTVPLAPAPEVLCQGGYPEPNRRPPHRARQWYRQYLNAIVQRDVRDIAAIQDEDGMMRLVELLAYRTAGLLNVSNLSKELGIERATVSKYLGILERLFLVHQLPAWHRNHAKRLIKSPKMHLVDTGLAAALGRLGPEQWLTEAERFGALLESHVVEQLVAQASWVDPELRFSHYRDKDQVEVDLVIERGQELWGVEVKRAASVQAKDAAGLARLAEQAGKGFRGGMLIYTGRHCLKLQVPGCFAVPIGMLWGEEPGRPISREAAMQALVDQAQDLDMGY
ncbi:MULTISPECIES: ATP-binding protein [unclassified Ectothiorhodospira]|uniref:ATP-binding protein n=1 Tax=unclassified Ectothiorhodospira TaxID=2684909 RepID=UPI001EE7EA93|nr:MULTISPECIES: ATP-binding protein [unclassified Ectothiorhodospira]MCG5517387.1 ATP-binding protein [Ectothiorhodospira sp. 9100]MCG5520283.1 ATP-binding protein [Ectothiorhodospira sp. 9905]